VTEYGAEQMTAGFRSMHMLAGLVRRGGRPVPVAPTIALRHGEKQFGWLPVTINGRERRVVVITNLRLIVGEESIPLWAITAIRPISGEWSVSLSVRGHAEPLVLAGPWVPWMSVVLCAELYGAAWPPGFAPLTKIPGPRQTSAATARQTTAGVPRRTRAGGPRHVAASRGKQRSIARENCR
jgi:hypothetical protein